LIYLALTNKSKIKNKLLPLSVQSRGGGHKSCRPFFFTTISSRARTYWFDATPPETTYNKKDKKWHLDFSTERNIDVIGPNNI